MNDFDSKIESFLEGAQGIVDKHWERSGYTHARAPKLWVAGGKKYLKVARTDDAGEGCSTSVHCFVDTTNGDVLKAASWKAPAKIARGNIFNEDNGLGCMGEYGAAYLRG